MIIFCNQDLADPTLTFRLILCIPKEIDWLQIPSDLAQKELVKSWPLIFSVLMYKNLHFSILRLTIYTNCCGKEYIANLCFTNYFYQYAWAVK